jgi:hypothetical protein
MAVGEWTPFRIEVDIDHLRYRASTGPTNLCEAIPLGQPKERFVELNGVNLPIAVPTFKEFKSVLFVPGGKPGSVNFVDDVTVRWTPAPVFAELGARLEFSEDFEAYTHATPVDAPPLKAKWQVSAAGLVIRDTSFGPGINSLRINRGGRITALTSTALETGTRLTLDLDLFVRSGEPLPSIMPNTATHFPHATRIGWSDAEGKMIAGIKTEQGTWHLLAADGTWVDTRQRVHYDVWNHLQLVLTEDGTLRAAAQPVGQVPSALGSTSFGFRAKPMTLTTVIEPSTTEGHVSCYDNIVLTSGSPSVR